MTEQWRVLLTALLAAGLAAAAYFGAFPLAVVSLVAGLAVAVGWPQLIDIPGRVSAAVTIAAMVLLAAVVVWFTDDTYPTRWLPFVLGMSVLVAFVRELLRGAPRERLVESVTGVVCGVVVGTFAVGWIAVDRSEGSVAIEVAGAAAIAASSVLGALPLRGWPKTVLLVVGATAAGFGIAYIVPGANPISGLLAGFLLGIVVASVHLLMDRLPAAGRGLATLTSIATPVAAGGLAVYVIALIGDSVNVTWTL